MPRLLDWLIREGENQSSTTPLIRINLVVDYLTENGVMEPDRLYESPFTDINPLGPEGVFPSAKVDQMVQVLTEIRKSAVA